MTATRSTNLLTILWGNGNTDVFANEADLAASYDDPSDEIYQIARDTATARTVEAGEEIDTASEEWSAAALAAIAAAQG